MLTRFYPFRGLDRLFGGSLDRGTFGSIPLDAYRRGETFFVHFDLPGVDPDSIEVTVDDDVLTVMAQRVWKEEEGDQLVACERPQGTFERHVYLSEHLDRDHVEARYDNGVLTVRMPIAEAAKPSKIPITVTKKPKEAGSSESPAAA